MQRVYKPKVLSDILAKMSEHEGLTLEGLLDLMSKIEMSQENWQAYLRKFSDKTLYRIILHAEIAKIDESTCFEPTKFDVPKLVLAEAEGKLDGLLSNPILMPHHDKAYLFCLLDVYDRVRAQEPEYKSNLAYVGSYFMSGYSQDEKKQFCNLYKEFICSHHRLNCFDQFLRQKNMYSKRSTIITGRLKLIHDLAESRGNDLDKEQEQLTVMLAK